MTGQSLGIILFKYLPSSWRNQLHMPSCPLITTTLQNCNCGCLYIILQTEFYLGFNEPCTTVVCFPPCFSSFMESLLCAQPNNVISQRGIHECIKEVVLLSMIRVTCDPFFTFLVVFFGLLEEKPRRQMAPCGENVHIIKNILFG